MKKIIWGNSRNGIQTGMVWHVDEKWGNLAMNKIDMATIWGRCKVKESMVWDYDNSENL